MKIVFLDSCAEDIRWFRHYYQSVFPAGKTSAGQRYKRSKQALKDNPSIGYELDDFKNIRTFGISNTPFSFIYRVTKTQIEVLRLWDGRQGYFE